MCSGLNSSDFPYSFRLDDDIYFSDILNKIPQNQTHRGPKDLPSGNYFDPKTGLTTDEYLYSSWEKGNVMLSAVLQVFLLEEREVKLTTSKATKKVLNAILTNGNATVQLSIWEPYIDEAKKKLSVGNVYLFQNLTVNEGNLVNSGTVEYRLGYKLGSNIRLVKY